MKKGKLIVFEGVSGTGKETQAKLLKDVLARKGITSHIIFHPSAELKLLLSQWRKERRIDAATEVYLLLADRYDRVRQLIVPALSRGEWVISLRSWVSALVYQGSNTNDRAWIAHEFSHFEPRPDYLFWFDITPDGAIERIAKRHRETGEPMGKFETPKLLTDKRNAYARILKTIPHTRINAAESIDTIHKRIVESIINV